MNFERERFDNFINECKTNIKSIMTNNKNWIFTPIFKDSIRVSLEGNEVFTDTRLTNGTKYNFLFMIDILKQENYKLCKYFWIDPDGEISKTHKRECSNMYIDEDGYLNAIHKDKCPYRQEYITRIDCYYNDIIYQKKILKCDTEYFTNYYKGVYY